MQAMPGASIGQRKVDWLFIAVLCFFIFTSFLIDVPYVLAIFFGIELPMIPLLLQPYLDAADPLMASAPPFLMVAVFLSGFVWGPFYLFLIRAFIRQQAGIRIPVFIYCGAMTMAMLMIFAEELYSHVPGWQTPDVIAFMATNLPYLLMPVALAIRFRSSEPFK